MLGIPRSVHCLGLVVLVGTLVVPLAAQDVTPGASTANDPDVVGAERLFSAWIEGQIAYRGLPGIAVGVVSDQELVWSKGFGLADIKARLPMTATTKFRIASNSKLFTAIAIMQLREEGKLTDATQELGRFRAAFNDADARLPADLRAWADSMR